jgi:arylsulfatase
VIGCTVRRDQTSMYGGPADATPFLASVAAEGARFEDLVTAAPWTRAASTAILTGHHPIEVGMAEPGPGRDERVLPDRVTTLAEHLHAAGWATAGLSTNPNLNRIYGFGQGFDVYRELARLWREDGVKMPGGDAADQAVALLDELPPGVPFYLQVVLVDAHAPFAADPGPFAAEGVPDEVARYRASLRQLDDAVARLDRALRARGHGPDDTVLAFTNDHGDGLSFPANQGASHGRYLGPAAVAGAVVLRGPGVARGQVVHGLASQVDLAPTLSALVGAPPFPGTGSDWSAAVRGSSDGTDRTRAFTETWFKDADRAAVYTPDEACQLDFAPVDGAAGAPFVDGCFRRASDPFGESPFADDDLLQVLRDWRRERLADAAAFGPVDRVTPDDATDAELEALGYVR